MHPLVQFDVRSAKPMMSINTAKNPVRVCHLGRGYLIVRWRRECPTRSFQSKSTGKHSSNLRDFGETLFVVFLLEFKPTHNPLWVAYAMVR